MHRLYQSDSRWSRDRRKPTWFWGWMLLTSPLLAAAAYGDEPPSPAKPEQHRFTNELIHSTSPYLLQHAHNPVNWMPWGPEAFAKAKRENKPIFVSIGYSTCYWCHVMERESFESEEVAAVLNEKYVAIKVDREQRPDIDEQLMIATQLLTGRGGWPNSVWLTVDGRPWMAGTYFPKPAFLDALGKLAEVWEQQPREVDQQANSFAEAIRKVTQSESAPATVLSAVTPLERAVAESQQLYDAKFGGIGSKPKFPPHGLLRLWAFDARENNNQVARNMLVQTLDAIYSGGIHDHVGGGYHRYATDERWFLPHFEKMLYDNAQLMRAYTEAYDLTQDPLYRQAVADIADWLHREMTHPQGGFYSAIDSESDGEEGRYYTWSMEELNKYLPADEAKFFAERYRFEVAGNFLEEATGNRVGTNIPSLQLESEPLRLLAADPQLAAMRRTLQQARSQREYPHLDDKILASWNGLMIASLANAGRSLSEPKYTEAAARGAEFVLRELIVDGKLKRTWRDGVAELPGFLEDHAFLAEGFLELHKTTGEPRWLNETQRLVDAMRSQFEDKVDGGFFFTGPEHEELIVRSKSLTGGGNMPVANGVAASVLLELFQLTGDPPAQQSLVATLAGLSGILHQSPREVEHLVLADARFHQLNPQPAVAADSQPDATFRGEALQAELFVSHNPVCEGQAITAAVVLNVDRGYYLYADDGQESELVRATTVKLRPAEGLTAGEPQSPTGERKLDPLLGVAISKLEGRVVFLLPATIALAPKQTQVRIQIDIEYQACDATRCLRPVTTTLECELTVAPQAGERRHTQLFLE